MDLLDARQSRPLEGGPTFSLRHRAFRAVWGVTWLLLASWTPPPLHRWRNLLLRLFGARIHPTARVYASVKIWYPPNLVMHAHASLGPGVNCYCMDTITVGEKAVVSQGAHLCCGTHDLADPDFQLQTRPIAISAGAWVAADAFIGPGVTIGQSAVIGARAVLFKHADALGVYAGNPARLIKQRVFHQ